MRHKICLRQQFRNISLLSCGITFQQEYNTNNSAMSMVRLVHAQGGETRSRTLRKKSTQS